MSPTYQRDRATQRTAAGVRTNPNHWANAPVHAHARWLSETTLKTWCDLTVDLEDGARQTTDLITCLACGEASGKGLRI